MKIKLLSGKNADIAHLGFHVDAIVNAANLFLLGGGGVDGAIHEAAGEKLLKACVDLVKDLPNRIGETGKAYTTVAGDLDADWVIHTPGPIWDGGDFQEEDLLKSSYQNSLNMADELGCKSIAFPCISTGIYMFPQKLAAKIAISVFRSFQPKSINEIYICAFDKINSEIYKQLLEE